MILHIFLHMVMTAETVLKYQHFPCGAFCSLSVITVMFILDWRREKKNDSFGIDPANFIFNAEF